MTVGRRDWVVASIRLAAVGLVMAIVVLSLLPGTLRPHTNLSGRYEHLMVYCAAACLVRLGFRVPFAAGLASFVVLAAVLELAQIWVPGRVPGVTDAIAGGLGGFAGLLAGLYLERNVRILAP